MIPSGNKIDAFAYVFNHRAHALKIRQHECWMNSVIYGRIALALNMQTRNTPNHNAHFCAIFTERSLPAYDLYARIV